MAQFIVKDQSKVDELSALLNQRFFSDNPQQFINMYNAGVVVKGNDDVLAILNLLGKAFKDVVVPARRSDMITLVSEEEVVLSETLDTLRRWEIASRLRREVQEAVDSGVVNPSAPLLLQKTNSGYILSTLHQVEQEDGTYGLVPEQLPRANSLYKEEAELVADSFAYDHASKELQEVIGDKGILVSPDKVLSVDNSFVRELVSHVPEFN